ncbi:MAG: dihydrofolate reductase family protein [Pseudonocardiaceae bacterium]
MRRCSASVRPATAACSPRAVPASNAQLAAADLVDELCLAIAPRLVGGDSRRILAGAPAGVTGFVLHTVCEDGGHLFLRLRRVTGR